MPENVIVVGASGGGVAALQQLVGGFPPNLPAAVLVVLHSSPDGPALLGEILDRSGPLPACNAVDGDRIESGRVYVAPPDWHLLCAEQHLHLWRGPKGNLHRPCINVTFRSASDEYGPRVIGAVLTGTLDDGTAGLWWIRKHGGTVVVQNPANAQYPEMPRNVLRHMSVDYCVDISEMGGLMARLACKTVKTEELYKRVDGMERQKSSIEGEEAILATCPDCSGPLREVRLDGKLREYRCLVGHSYSPMFLLRGHDEAEERALWAAAASLEQAVPLARKLGECLSDEDRITLEEDAAEKLALAAELHRLIGRLRKFRLPVVEKPIH